MRKHRTFFYLLSFVCVGMVLISLSALFELISNLCWTDTATITDCAFAACVGICLFYAITLTVDCLRNEYELMRDKEIEARARKDVQERKE